jgi:hypothetical protein
MSLVPRYSNSEGSADLTIYSPIFEEIHNLSFALHPTPADVSSAGLIRGSIQEIEGPYKRCRLLVLRLNPSLAKMAGMDFFSAVSSSLEVKKDRGKTYMEGRYMV